jgi:MFS family permease
MIVLLGANAVSMTGNVIALVAIPWFVLQTTGSATKTGLAAFCNFLPTVVAAMFGGTFVDRIGFKTSSVMSDVTSGLTIAFIPLLHTTVGLAFWQLLTLIFVGALLDSPGTTARAALVPSVSAQAGWTLERASGMNAAIERSSRLIGAPLGGVLVGLVGATGALWFDAASFLLSAGAVAVAVPGVRPTHRDADRRYLGELKEGVSFLLRDPLVKTIVFMVTATNFLDVASYSVLLPVYADRVFDSPVSLGLMMGASGGGAVLGALLFSAHGHKLSRRAVYTWGFIAVTLWYPVLAAFPPLGIAVASMALAGLGAGPLNPIIDTVLYERIPESLRGRVLGAVKAFAWMAMPAGVLIGGVLLDHVGLRTLLLVWGGCYLAVTLSLRGNRAIKKMDEAHRPARSVGV